MKARSTQASHWQGAIVAGTRLYNGVKLEGASSNSTVIVEAFGDDTNIPINLRGKGTGNVILGNSSQAAYAGKNLVVTSSLTVGAGATFSSGTLIASSGLKVGTLDTVRGFVSTSYRFLIPAVGVGALAEYALASTIADVVPGDLFSLYPTAASSLSTSLRWNYRLSTAAASRVTITFYNPHSTTATSTGSGVWQMQWVKFV